MVNTDTKRRGFWLVFGILLFVGMPSHARQPVERPSGVVVSSVSPEFPDGLHARYLHFIAQQLDVELEIIPMPFARRLASLQSNEIDMMVGLRYRADLDETLIVIQPGYERVGMTVYALAEQAQWYQKRQDLLGKRVALTLTAHGYGAYNFGEGIKIIPVSRLQQKIDMLRLGRTDVFAHLTEATEKALLARNLQERIVATGYQPIPVLSFHVAIGKQSVLVPRVDELTAIVEKAVADGTFAALRDAHYGSENDVAHP
ncbi:transporter substrate-binding domain-containing protein [Aestuariibacter halophilus]|uniref:Transporter substrate-binding domain-containing protein n=1 Tax=Fluctibacter halophilus TaxID=226011 RepID=A0ABS8GAY3_9ALTE|nr:transporter substrate-binding domain-containing protein [Aestuariibacter halophilus]MCC2617697.1 transporter substrate-binding domain-containing protein [Aestuariibacter halophilus]